MIGLVGLLCTLVGLLCTLVVAFIDWFVMDISYASTQPNGGDAFLILLLLDLVSVPIQAVAGIGLVFSLGRRLSAHPHFRSAGGSDYKSGARSAPSWALALALVSGAQILAWVGFLGYVAIQPGGTDSLATLREAGFLWAVYPALGLLGLLMAILAILHRRFVGHKHRIRGADLGPGGPEIAGTNNGDS